MTAATPKDPRHMQQYGYDPDRKAILDTGLRVVHSEEEHDNLRNPDYGHVLGAAGVHPYIKGISQVYVVGEFPKLAYKKSAAAPGFIQKTLNNGEDEKNALKVGWATRPKEIHAILDPIFAPISQQEIEAAAVELAAEHEDAQVAKRKEAARTAAKQAAAVQPEAKTE